MNGKKEEKGTWLDLEAARASPTAGSFEFPAFALDVRFLVSPKVSASSLEQ